MIYLVTSQQSLFTDPLYVHISVEESLNMMKDWKSVQFDTETNGRDAHVNDILMAQFGDYFGETQIVVDCSTINILNYKEVLENKLVVGQNLKFDLQFLYNYSIIPRRVYDTMIVEQLLYLGFPHITVTPEEYEEYGYTFPYHCIYNNLGEKNYSLSFALDAIAKKRLNKEIDKSVRGEIIWRGIDTTTIEYAANDVVYLADIMKSQMQDAKKQGLEVAVKVECDFVPVIAYLEWCGIYLNEDKWRAKMEKDKNKLTEARKALDDFVIRSVDTSRLGPQRNIYTPINADGSGGAKIYEELRDFVYINTQGDLFNGFDLEPKVDVNWSSSQQVIKVAKILGFNTTIQDKKTGEDKDSVIEKHLSSQKGINDEFIKLYFDYQGYSKVVTSFGQGHLNQINPNTGRIHTVYRQLGTTSGRMSCGSTQPNTDLAKLKELPPKECTYANMQQLPHDAETRGCFMAEEGNMWVSCDWSAAEARLAGDIYNDQAIKDIFLNGIDSHSMYAKIFFKEQLKDIDVKDVKKLRPDLRQLAKGPEFEIF